MFGETEHDSSQQLTSVPIEEQLDAFGRVLDVGKVCCMRYACKIRIRPICLMFLVAIFVRLQVRPMY